MKRRSGVLFFIFSFSFFFYFRSRNFLKLFFGKNKVFLSFGFFNNVFSFENIAPGQKAQTNLYKKINRKTDLVFEIPAAIGQTVS